jgi:hypothetical protein
MKTSLLRATVLLAVLMDMAPAGWAINFTTFDVPGATSTALGAVKGNNMVGFFTDSSNAQHGFMYDGTNVVKLDVPSAVGSATRANDFSGNNIVGYYTDAGGTYHGFIYDGTKYVTLNDPSAGTASGQGTQIFGIDGNNLVGVFFQPSGLEQGFRYDGTTFTTIAPTPTTQTAAFGLQGNQTAGALVEQPAGTLHGFIYDGTTFAPVDDPAAGVGPGRGTDLFRVSGSQRLGIYIDNANTIHGFLYDGTNFITVDDPAGTTTIPSGIDGNRIVGRYIDTGGATHGFIATVPEPTSLLLLVTGMVTLLTVASRSIGHRLIVAA